MTPARSLAASVAALGFASTITVPLPALAASRTSILAHAAPAPCERAERWAAQAEAEFLRIERLDLRGGEKREHGAGVTKRDSGERPSVSAPEPAGDVLKQLDGIPSTPKPTGDSGPAKDKADTDPGSGSDSGKVADTDDSDKADQIATGTGKTSDSGKTTANSAPDSSGKGGTPESAAESKGLLGGIGHLLGGLVPAADRSGETAAGSGAATFQAAAFHSANFPGTGIRTAALRAGGDDRTELGKPGAADAEVVGGPTGDPSQVISGVGVGDARSVMIADAPVKSAAAGLVLDGRVAGAPAAEQVLQQAPPSHPKPTEQHSGARRFGPIQVGAGAMSAHARWDPAMGCAGAAGQVSDSATRLERVTLNGGLIRVPDKISSLSSTAMSGRGSGAVAIASATVTAGRIELAGGEVRIRVLRAPTLRVGMSAAKGAEVRYRPAVVEVSGKNLPRTTLNTASEQVDVTVSDAGQVTESATVPVLPSQGSPLPSIPGLPAPSDGADGGTPASPGSSAPSSPGGSGNGLPASLGGSGNGTPASPGGSGSGTSASPGGSGSGTALSLGGSGDEASVPSKGFGIGAPVAESALAGGKVIVRVSLGDVRQASKGHAVAARATAIKVSVLRPAAGSADRGKAGYEPSAVVADLGIGVLEAAAVAPEQGRHAIESGVQDGTLPLTGPRMAPVFVTGASLLVGGVCAFLLGALRRRRTH
ncbi:hypothetical protein [Actinoplanes sp. L3-i22]|uniref:hypothetical protein n=1 Tax=Actinoplanes sp. L3-i22 TaxID=2836373 RepID=UPI001C74ED82|nr:hypothetical protein [Actinoplanes sp. L3-i22]BCY05203.1 hypothetical protein L3i22_002910 [Actinoplanes sp. L3-i22]